MKYTTAIAFLVSNSAADELLKKKVLKHMTNLNQ